MSTVRRAGAATVALCIGALVFPEVAAAANKPPKIARGRMVDADSDGRPDRLVLTYTERIRHKADRDGRYPFRVQGYKIAGVKKARRTRKLVIRLRESEDAPRGPNVRYRRTRKKPVTDLRGKQAKRQTFVDVLPIKVDGGGGGQPNDDVLSVVTEGPGSVLVAAAGLPTDVVCQVSCEVPLDTGTLATLTAVPDAGSAATFEGWAGDCASFGATPVCTLTMDADKDVEAAFAAAGGGGDGGDATLTVVVAGDGSGTVTSVPEGISCPGTCTADFDDAAEVALTAVPELLYGLFEGWGGDCSTSGAVPLCTVTMDGDKNVTASFSSI